MPRPMRQASRTLCAALILGALAPAPALAAGSDESAPSRRSASVGPLTLELRGGIEMNGRRYVLEGQRVVVEGRSARFAAGEGISFTISGPGRGSSEARAALEPAGTGGRFRTEFTAQRTGVWTATAADSDGAQAVVAAHAVDPRVRRGSRGTGVRLMQRGLGNLGYVTPLGGRFDAATARAVIAFRKVGGMARRPTAGRAVLAKLFRGEGGYALRHPGSGKHVEFDFSRQVLVLARGGRVERIYHAASGKRSTPTVFGTFSFYRKEPGTNRLGMVSSNYFIRGYAIHGYRSVPTRPASHGCIRVPIPNAVSISRWVALGDRIHVYR